MFKTIMYFLIFLFISCDMDNKVENKTIEKFINSTSVDEIVKGYYLIGENKKSKFVKDIFYKPEDLRISHNYRFKGISVYQSKMIALKKISGLHPPNKITHSKDSVIIAFYYEWALNNKLLDSIR